MKGNFEAGNGSCLGVRSCIAAGKETVGSFVVGDGSCVSNVEGEDRACELVANKGTAAIGNGSCVGDDSCRHLARAGTATVGNDSCTGFQACMQTADLGGEIEIGNGSCQGAKSCKAIGREDVDGVTVERAKIEIGDNSCNCDGCCGCLKAGDKVPDNMCNDFGDGESHCCLDDGDRNPYGPLWVTNLCVEEEDKCVKASVTGDPHLTTFSKLKYDCMAQGEFVLAKSASNPLEIRGLFVDPEFYGQDDPWESGGGAATTTRGVAFKVDEDIPLIRITTDHEKDSSCSLYYYVEGVGNVTQDQMLNDDTLFKREDLTVTAQGTKRMKFLFGDYDAELWLSVRPSKNWGCMIAFTSCLKPKHYSDVTGLFGTNNPYKNDDWTTPDGTVLQIPTNPKTKAGRGLSSAYCRENWCVDAEGDPASNSFFSEYDYDFFSRCDKSPYKTYESEALDDMLAALRESCDEMEKFHIPSEVLYDAALARHITDPENTECPLDLLEEAERNNLIAQMNCEVAPTPPPVSLPTEAPTNTQGTEIAEAKGDPHFKTWWGEHFEYHGQCDLVLLKDPSFADGLGIQVQIRTKLVRYWSYIRSVAILIGDEILEIEGSDDFVETDELFYWYNLEEQSEIKTLGGFSVFAHRQSKKKQKFIIDLSPKYPGQSIEVMTFKEFVKFTWHNGSEESVGNSIGLMGNFKTGETLGRDGRVFNDYTEFGAEWQVRPEDDSLFHNIAQPQFPKTCVLPEDPQGQRRRRLDESNIKEEDAEKACASLKDALDRKECVYDILATQDLEMAGAF